MEKTKKDILFEVMEALVKRNFKIINVANMEVLNFVLGQTEGRVRADLLTLQGDNKRGNRGSIPPRS